ncbi:MAG: hypothetical protein WCK35_15660 [Chloroflexota bacterium]
MPTEIVIESCPAPKCNLSEQDIEELITELKDYISMFEPAFQRGTGGAKRNLFARLAVIYSPQEY